MSLSHWTRRLQTVLRQSPRRSHRPKPGRLSGTAPPGSRLNLEPLEDRTLLSLFSPAQFFATGSSPASVAVGDFNNDGSLDLAVANAATSGTVSILLGTGSGFFRTATNYAVGSFPDSVAVGEFVPNLKPPHLDLAVTNFFSNTVSVLLGNGNGTFAPAVNYPVGAGPTFVAVGDFNHDGIPDLVVANQGGNTVSVLLGNGDGTFAPAVNYPVGQSPASVAVGDFNRDGNLDLAVANGSGNNVSVLLGNGDGTFGAAVNYAVGLEPVSVAVGDFNRDGIPDLVVANQGGNTVSVLLGNGDGTFKAATNFPAGVGPTFVAVGDFNRDGNPDLVVANSTSNSVSVLAGNGTGGFGAPTSFPTGSFPDSVAVGDFNGDGAPDLAVANEHSNSVGVLLNQTPVTTTALASSANPSRFGQQVTLTATVSPAVLPGFPDGLVTFMDTTTVLGTATLDPATGQASLNTSTLGTGYHALTAVYQGNPRFTGSTSPVLNQLVNQVATTTVLSSSANPALAGQPLTLTATVSAPTPAPGFSLPTGTVFFERFDIPSPVTLGSAPLVNGTATLTIAAPPAAAMLLSARYAGADPFQASASANLTEVVNNPVPAVTGMAPATLPEGSPAFTLTLTGSNFLSGATVQWNGTSLTVTQLSGTQIQATVPAALLADEGSARVTVTNPGPGGGASLAQTFTVADGPLAASGRDLNVLGNKSFSGAVATFTDANPAATAADFSAFVVWDDGSADFATVTGTGPFTVTASHHFGAFPNAHTVTVTIDDRGGSTVTVTDTVIDPVALSPSQGLVAGLYQDLLGRAADAGGLAFWSGLLDGGAPRSQVVLGILNSTEYRQDEVTKLYHQLLHRDADPLGLSYFTGLLAGGETAEQVGAQIAGSAEYYQNRGGGSAAGFLAALYGDALDRQPDALGQAVFTAALASGASPGQVAATVFASTEYRQDLVAGYYQAYLGRTPDALGLNYFVGILGQGGRDDDVLVGVLGSDEYFRRL
jgi:hypothetical protein